MWRLNWKTLSGYRPGRGKVGEENLLRKKVRGEARALRKEYMIACSLAADLL